MRAAAAAARSLSFLRCLRASTHKERRSRTFYRRAPRSCATRILSGVTSSFAIVQPRFRPTAVPGT